MERFLLVGVGAFVGAIARYGLGLWFSERFGPGFPIGTLVVNVSGSFLLGFLVVHATERLGLGEPARLLLGVGFCGGFTTFSAFALETMVLLEARAYLAATLNILVSVALSILGVVAGIWLARTL